jgi:hypothetical protein
MVRLDGGRVGQQERWWEPDGGMVREGRARGETSMASDSG